MNVRIIANPIAGGGKGAIRASELCHALESRGLDCDLYITRRSGDARAEAARPGADIVVAVGGDGSVNEVANGLRGSAADMAILPLGTANVVARELGVLADPQRIADSISGGRRRPMDAGVINGRLFLLGAGAGLDAAVVEEVHARRGARLSFFHYVAPVLHKVQTYPMPRFRVVVDGTTLCDDAQYAVVGNCRYSAGIFPLTPEARVDDGLLDVCVFRNLTIPRIAMLAAAAFRPSFSRRSDLLYTQGRTIAFEPMEGGRVPLQVDGDPAGALPATFTVEPGALRMVVP